MFLIRCKSPQTSQTL